MTDRRDFLKGGMVAASALVMGSANLAVAVTPISTNIVYTKANPEKWNKKENTRA